MRCPVDSPADRGSPAAGSESPTGCTGELELGRHHCRLGSIGDGTVAGAVLAGSQPAGSETRRQCRRSPRSAGLCDGGWHRSRAITALGSRSRHSEPGLDVRKPAYISDSPNRRSDPMRVLSGSTSVVPGQREAFPGPAVNHRVRPPQAAPGRDPRRGMIEFIFSSILPLFSKC